MPHLWKGKEGRRIEQRKKLNCDVVLMIASVANMSPCEAGMTHQNCPKLDWEGWYFIPYQSAIVYRLIWVEDMTLNEVIHTFYSLL